MGLNNAQAQFVKEVSDGTAIDPRVLVAWLAVENADAPNGTGHYNYLNLRPYAGDPYVAVSSGGFEQFADPHAAAVATVRRIRQPFAAPIETAAHRHVTPRQEIAAIASTGWDSGHYGGPPNGGGPTLAGRFAGIFSPAGLDSGYVSPANAAAIAATAGTGSASDAGSGDLTTVASGSVGSAVSSAGGSVWGIATGLWNALTWPERIALKVFNMLTSADTWIRVALFLGGLVLIGGGLYIALGKGAVPIPV